MSQQKIH